MTLSHDHDTRLPEPLRFAPVVRDRAAGTPRSKMRSRLAEVAERHGLTVDDLTSPASSPGASRRPVAWARQEAMWTLRRETTLSLPRLGQVFGGRDHTTILHGIRRHDQRIAGAAPMPLDEAVRVAAKHLVLCDAAATGNDAGAALWRDTAAAIRKLIAEVESK